MPKDVRSSMGFSTKINGLAMSRGRRQNMEPLLPDEGKVFIFADVVACEPTIQCNITGDETLIYQVFSGKGKEPFYDKTGLLMIDDVYLAFASINPVSSDKMLEMFTEGRFGDDGLTFSQAWLKDKDIIKDDKVIKPIRKFNKGGALGLSYGLLGDTNKAGDTEHGLRNIMAKQGYIMTSEQAWACYKAYWNMYPKIRDYAKKLTKALRCGKPVFNPFGKLVTSKPKDAYNGLIQSTTSSIVSYAEYLLEQREMPDIYEHVITIHDEIVVQVPKECAEEVCSKIRKVGEEITGMLGWEFPVVFDPKVAHNFYEGK